MRIALLFLFWCLSVSCLEKKSAPANSDAFRAAREVSELTDKKLGEISGLAPSAANPGMMWVHNDSGNPPVVYLVDEKLNIRLSCRLKGIKNRDWEDIAVGPGPEKGKRYVYVADIGDNNARYEEKHIYRFEEPVTPVEPKEITITDFEKITFKLEDGKKDTEALWVHPESQHIYLVSKREKPVHVYELRSPFETHGNIARSIAALPLTQIVAADISAKGDEIIMKNYDNVYYWNLSGKSLTAALEEEPQILNYKEEPQGEAIAFSIDGSGFFTLSEKIKGEKTYLYFYPRNRGEAGH